MIRLDYYGVEGTGRTVTEAKKDAGERIRQALAGPYTPTVLSYRGTAMLVYREPGGWCYRIIAEPDGIRDGKVWGSPNDPTEADALRAAGRHLADITMQEADTDPPAFVHRDDVREWRRSLDVLRRYRQAQRAGLTDEEARSYALRDPARPDLQTRVPEEVGA